MNIPAPVGGPRAWALKRKTTRRFYPYYFRPPKWQWKWDEQHTKWEMKYNLTFLWTFHCELYICAVALLSVYGCGMSARAFRICVCLKYKVRALSGISANSWYNIVVVRIHIQNWMWRARTWQWKRSSKGFFLLFYMFQKSIQIDWGLLICEMWA